MSSWHSYWIGLVLVGGCQTEVRIDAVDPLPSNEGGFAGTGEPDPESAALTYCESLGDASACWRKQPKECFEWVEPLLALAQRTQCEEEALGYFNCVLMNVDRSFCSEPTGTCDGKHSAWRDCYSAACQLDVELCEEPV